MFLFGKKPLPPSVSAVIASAGRAERMEGIDKQQAQIDETPVVVRSVEAISACEQVGEVVLVCREEYIADYYALVREFELLKVSSVVGGGESRQRSVFRGVAACSEQAQYLLVHDGARPLVEPELVRRCIDAAIEHGAAAAGIAPKDTIKTVDTDRFILSTPDREGLVCIQTPQVFRADIYRAAMAAAQRERREYTDDCQLVERAGVRVFVVPGSYENIKITTPEDLAVAAAVLQYREEGLDQWQTYE